jgi:biopolymer transport protein ExbB
VKRAGLLRPAGGIALLLLALTGTAAPADGQADPASDAPPRTLGELLERVRDAAQREEARAAERERRFLEAREEQGALLAEVRRAREAADAEADRLQRAYEAGEQELADLETALSEQSGDLEELFSIVRQTAEDARTLLTDSLVAGEHPEREATLDALTDPETVPGAEDLRAFWVALLEEMEGGGRVSRFEAPVISTGGEEPETGRFLAVATAPAGTDPAAARAFEEAREPLLPVAVDPSRGAILSLVVQTPDLEDRVRQGGVIGYLIIGLGLFGLVVALERIGTLFLARRRMERSLKNGGGHRDLDALQAAAADRELARNPDGLAARFDEIVTGASRRLHRGVQVLSIFAAVTPLLGLLGTVTGMIETFQVITLFGAGDPRLMSGGISQALVTTQLGLCAAIPLLLLHSFVQGRANALVGMLDERSARLFASIHPERPETGEDAPDR